MKAMRWEPLYDELEDDCKVVEQFFDPWATYQCKIQGKEIERIQHESVFCKLLTFHEGNIKNEPDFDQNLHAIAAQQLTNKDENLAKILGRQKVGFQPPLHHQFHIQQCLHSFNQDRRVRFDQTPVYKCVMQSPIRVFCKKYNYEIQQLCISSASKEKFKELRKKQNPCLFIDKGAAFFVGIGLTMQKEDHVYECLFFLNLACYIEPYNPKVWQQIITYTKKCGLWNKAYELCKTAFLFTINPLYAQQYLACGDKAKIAMYEQRGLLSSLRRPEEYEKTVVQSAKFEIKNRKVWRGLILLNRMCAMHGYKPSFSYAVILLAKCLESVGFSELAIKVLQKSIQKGISKFEAYFTYIEIKLRINKGRISEKQISILDSYTDNLTLQTRYRLPLCIAEILINMKNKNYSRYISKAFTLADKNCKAIGKDRAFRQIYFTLLSALNLKPSPKLISNYRNDQYLIFLANRKKFIQGSELIMYRFQNWKYYLHYALLKNANIMIQAFEENNQGRIIAEAIHILRLTKTPLQVLKFWRQKITEIPKSGELWCEGGRIYADMGQLQNAIRCFNNAIHFTPQFGDSFLQLLKIHLIVNNFYQINNLRKTFQISQPYYGNVLSFLQSKHYMNYHCKLSLRYIQIWEHAVREINFMLYSGAGTGMDKAEGKRETDLGVRLTACVSYNRAFINPVSGQLRQILFCSYEQMENKITKT